MASREDVRTSTLALLGFLGAILLFVILIGLQVFYYRVVAAQRTEKDVTSQPPKIAAAVADQRAKLAEYRVLDAKTGAVRVPIDRAMDLVLRDLERKPQGR